MIIDTQRYCCLLRVWVTVRDIRTKLQEIFKLVHVSFNDSGKELFIHSALNVNVKWKVVVET